MLHVCCSDSNRRLTEPESSGGFAVCALLCDRPDAQSAGSRANIAPERDGAMMVLGYGSEVCSVAYVHLELHNRTLWVCVHV